MTPPTPWDPSTEYRIVASGSPVTVDGYALGEPKRLTCGECGASVELTAERTPGVDYLRHDPDCGQFESRSAWFREQFSDLDPE